jgi:hypothetical protein
MAASMSAAPAPPVPGPRLLLLSRIERYVLAHITGYPIAFLWAMAAIPLTIQLSIRDLDALHDDMPAIGQLVVRRLLWPAAVVFALPHLFAIPWAFGRDPDRFRRRTWIAIGGLAAAGVLFGAVSWLWLFLR